MKLSTKITAWIYILMASVALAMIVILAPNTLERDWFAPCMFLLCGVALLYQRVWGWCLAYILAIFLTVGGVWMVLKAVSGRGGDIMTPFGHQTATPVSYGWLLGIGIFALCVAVWCLITLSVDRPVKWRGAAPEKPTEE